MATNPAEPDAGTEPAPQRSRRAVLAAGVGALGAFAASAVAKPATVLAGSDGDVVLGSSSNASGATTKITVPTASFSSIWGLASATSGTGVGVRGDAASPDGLGIWGVSGGTGVRGDGATGIRGKGSYAGVQAEGSYAGVIGKGGASDTSRGVIGEGGYGVEARGAAFGVWATSGNGVGVQAFSGTNHAVSAESDTGIGVRGASAQHVGVVGVQTNNGTGVAGMSGGQTVAATPKPKTGVYGQASQDAASRGVWGVSTAGQGVRGEAGTGVGVSGNASNAAGYAFRGSGRVGFDKVSGVAILAAGTTSKVITPGTDVTADSFVLLTPGADIGTRRLWFTKDTTANTITIRLSSSRTSATSISWLLLR